MKKGIIVVTYKEEAELNTFLAQNGTNLEVSAVYEDLDAADVEHVEGVIAEEVLEAKDEEKL